MELTISIEFFSSFFCIHLHYLQLMDFKKTILFHFNQHQLQRIHHPGESSNLTNPEKGINCIQPLKVQELTRVSYTTYISLY